MSAHGTSSTSYSKEYLEEDSGNTLVGISVMFIVLNILFVALRVYARQYIRGEPRDATSSRAWDDFLSWCTLHVAGVGRHAAYVRKEHPHQLVQWAKCIYALEWIYLAAVALPKLSILFLYLRIFVARFTRLVTYILMATVIANWAAFLLASIFQCSPVRFQWDKSTPGGKCFNVPLFYKLVNVPNIATDLVILVLPLPTVWHLKVSRAKKFGLTLVFLTGSIGIIASCVRMTVFFQTDAFTDNTWASFGLVGWSVVEPGMYLIASCLPALRPIFSRFMPAYIKALFNKVLMERTKQSGSNHNQDSFRMRGIPLSSSQSQKGFAKLESDGPLSRSKGQDRNNGNVF
ncbi:uncharacterized protein BP5553_04366 [Venustampulla echinocandica]|uniref:Rhodopsin domain-containing protein n=1 Tax=Venustampulla echinocandica TaxID=2656787 RepID=A0A370TN16_9HELO|nr:uncharacterized protein BP5553_04366 [Venustampulla echinocandica]RDL36933.1 hypothetical protein BP5553_04366 [Venustampulla echinocandica]